MFGGGAAVGPGPAGKFINFRENATNRSGAERNGGRRGAHRRRARGLRRRSGDRRRSATAIATITRRDPREVNFDALRPLPTSMRNYSSTILLLFIFLFGAPAAFADLYVCSFNDSRIYRYDDQTGALLGIFVTTGSGGLAAPHGLQFGADNHLYVASANNDRILKYNGQTGAFMATFVASGSGGLDYPAGICFGADGDLYVASQLSNQILRYNGTTGAFLGVFVTSGAGGLNGPSDLLFGPDGNLYVSSRFNSAVYCYDGASGAFVRTVAASGAGGLSTAFGISFGADLNIYVSSANNSSILKFDPLTGAPLGAFVTSGGGGLSVPIVNRFGPDGNLYVCSYSNNRILRYNGSTGASMGDFVLPANAPSGPNWMLFRPNPDHLPFGIVNYGSGTNGCNGVSRIAANLIPKVNSPNFIIHGTNAPPNSLGLCLVTDTQDAAGFDYFSINVQILLNFATATEILALDAASDGVGFGSTPAPIPNNPLLANNTYYAQFLWYWPPICSPSPLGLSSSEGGSITIQP